MTTILVAPLRLRPERNPSIRLRVVWAPKSERSMQCHIARRAGVELEHGESAVAIVAGGPAFAGGGFERGRRRVMFERDILRPNGGGSDAMHLHQVMPQCGLVAAGRLRGPECRLVAITLRREALQEICALLIGVGLAVVVVIVEVRGVIGRKYLHRHGR